MPDYILQNVLSDHRCEKCGAEVEFAFQDSRDCGIAREVWKRAGMEKFLAKDSVHDIKDWLRCSILHHEDSRAESRAPMIALTLWYARNALHFQQKCIDSAGIVQVAHTTLQRYREANASSVSLCLDS